MTTTVTIKGKQCGPTSEITPEIANKLYAKKGTRILAIVEIKSDTTHEGIDGDRKVDCTIESFEPVVDGKLNGEVIDTVRRLHRALAVNRSRLSPAGDEALEFDDNEPTVEGVLGAANALVETDESGEPVGIWDGDPDSDDADDPEADTEDDEPDDEPAPADNASTVPNPFAMT